MKQRRAAGPRDSWTANVLHVIRQKGQPSLPMEAVLAGEDLLLGKLGFTENGVDLLYPLKTLSARLHREDGVFVAGLDE